MRTKKDIATGGLYFHVINHGFAPSDIDRLSILARNRESGIVGAVFRLGHLDDVSDMLARIGAAADEHGLMASIHLRLGHDNPAMPGADQSGSVDRIRAAMNASVEASNLRIFSDALNDIDRGYFPRTGAIDCTGTPNMISNLVRDIHAGID